MKHCYTYCEKGQGQSNEDVCGFVGSFAWVIDGATDLFNRHQLFRENEVSRYVNLLNEKLVSTASDFGPDQIIEFLDSAIQSLYIELNIADIEQTTPEYMLPTFAVTMVSWEETNLHYFQLGDCFLAFEIENQIQILTDNRIEPFSKYNSDCIRQYYNTHKTYPNTLPIYQETRKKANAADGYPIGSVSGRNLNSAITGTITLEKGQYIVICSDGFLDYFTEYPDRRSAFLNPDTIKKEISDRNLFLDSDAHYNQNPRPKKIDDRTIMLLEV